jgi:hypothetical protein
LEYYSQVLLLVEVSDQQQQLVLKRVLELIQVGSSRSVGQALTVASVLASMEAQASVQG